MLNRVKDRIYDVVLFLATHGFRKKSISKKLLIVRVDQIGDYMLWHTLLKATVSSDKFKGYELHFCGNRGWKDVFIHFHADLASHSFWLDKVRFKKDMMYRYKFLKQVYLQGYDIVINPIFSRDKRNDDAIVQAAKAKQAIGMVADQENVRPYDKRRDHTLYTQLFDCPQKPVFEFYAHKLFAEFVSEKTIAIQDTKLNTQLLPTLTVDVPQNYFVVFPGSRSSKRIWPTESFVQVSKYLFNRYEWTAIVCGSTNDAIYATNFCSQYTHPFLNLTGKTSVLEMLSLLRDAKCLLSVDTGSVHLAASVGCTVFGIFNGSQYGRFAPYPQEIASKFYAVYPDEIEDELKNEKLVKEKYEFVVDIPYASVKPEKVIQAFQNYYNI